MDHDFAMEKEGTDYKHKMLRYPKLLVFVTYDLAIASQEGLSQLEKLKQKNISISAMGQGKLRMVTHLDYREVMHTYVLETLSKLAL